MDIFRRKKFDEAMFTKNRTLAIRVGQYQSSDIKEASFDYGYIKGDAYKPGGTCAGSAKIVFTSIISTFNKLDKIYPEIGLLVDGTYEWVKMGEYFINDIEIDRNRKTTKLDLMDGMFKLNREHVTDLTYPAEVRQVIKEICLKTGVKLANENMDITSMNYVIENIPKDKKMTFRDVLSLATQMLGMSCFFNREGKLEIKELTDSGITITADSYFMHGLTKSEVEYQIAGITCKKDKETLTVGMRTGRSLELDNLFMSQAILDNLYHKIKDIRYYPFNLNYQGHLLLDVGEWVTIKTNTGETFKSPVLSQSFTFKGGLRGRISADSKAGNDAQYSYAGTITKKIEQFSEFEKQIQNQLEEADKGFDHKAGLLRQEISDGIELAKAKAEEVKRSLTETIDQRFSSFNNGPLQEAKRRADEALKKVGANTLLAQEAKQISEQLRRQLDNKADLVEFQRVKETNQLYERIIGRSEFDIADKVARMALTNQLFQIEVAKASAGGRNLFLNSLFKRDLHQRYSTYHVDDSVEQTQGQLALSIDENTKFRGANTLKIVSTFNGKPNNQKVTFRTGGDMRLNTADEMRNKSVRFSFWAKSTVNNTNFQARAGYRNAVEGVSLTTDWKFYDIQLTKSENSNASNEVIMHVFTAATVWIAFPKVEIGTVSTDFSEAPEDTDEAIRTVQSQLAGSWSVQNLTSAGAIISQINATNNQILIEAEKIRLKGKTLLDELTAIQGYFKRLFVGEGNFAKLNAEIIGSKTITADKLIMDQAMARMFVSSDIFTDTLAAKEAFINKLRSVVVSATLLEGYKGKIGGFQIGTHDKDPHTFWITGSNSFRVGMGDVGPGNWDQTALWVNWGDDWNKPGEKAWFVNARGEMKCYNQAHFWNVPVIHGDLHVGGNIFYQKDQYNRGYWIYSPDYNRIARSNGYVYLSGENFGGSDWIPLNKEISDRRYKHNIEASTVSGLEVIEQLKTYSYRKEYDGKIEDIACGIMAQDVQKYIPEAFYENPDGAYSYRTFELVPYLIKAIQELNQKIEKLEKTA
nr:MAG TPA: Neck appendage protein [Caudoviricetes sp.]